MRRINHVGMGAGGDIREITIVDLDIPRSIEQSNGRVIGIRQIYEPAIGDFDVSARIEIIRYAIDSPIRRGSIEYQAVQFEVLTSV